MATYIPRVGLVMEEQAPSANTGGTDDVWNTHDGMGEKEDISSIIGLISPYDTPNYSQFRKSDAIQPVHQWQTDVLRAPAANGAVEGFESTVAPGSNTGMLVNYTQIFTDNAAVSGTALSTEFYGRANELDYQVMKRGQLAA
ncbi:unnamed protein product [marine sediment metagenome]|uniref:Uncharacterized protein n=1 Tax=marine sediment metagenome TaxID=412755 RepID=X0SMP6_9ZZZZ